MKWAIAIILLIPSLTMADTPSQYWLSGRDVEYQRISGNVYKGQTLGSYEAVQIGYIKTIKREGTEYCVLPVVCKIILMHPSLAKGGETANVQFTVTVHKADFAHYLLYSLKKDPYRWSHPGPETANYSDEPGLPVPMPHRLHKEIESQLDAIILPKFRAWSKKMDEKKIDYLTSPEP